LISLLLAEAWHVISSTDPLVDSDDESGGDENMREDYREFLNRNKHLAAN
jgi:hypothetical protein